MPQDLAQTLAELSRKIDTADAAERTRIRETLKRLEAQLDPAPARAARPAFRVRPRRECAEDIFDNMPV